MWYDFLTADKIAEKLGFGKESELRAEAGILCVLHELSDEGHVNYPYEPLTEKCNEILQIDREIIAKAIAAIAFEKRIVRLLEFSPKKLGFQKNEEEPLDCDLLIVDEFSMVDCILMHHLLKAIPPHATFIMVGDVNQLYSLRLKYFIPHRKGAKVAKAQIPAFFAFLASLR